jgi:putative flippase GtrA
MTRATINRPMNRVETQLHRYRGHPTIGPTIRFYFARREQVLYLVVGAWNTLFAYSVWAVLQFLLGGALPYWVILVITWPIVVTNAYFGYRVIVFRSQGRPLVEFPRFASVYAIILVANLVLLPIALRTLPFNIYVVQALFTLAVVICGYLAHKSFSFRPTA